MPVMRMRIYPPGRCRTAKLMSQQLVYGEVGLGYGIPCVIFVLWTKKNT